MNISAVKLTQNATERSQMGNMKEKLRGRERKSKK